MNRKQVGEKHRVLVPRMFSVFIWGVRKAIYCKASDYFRFQLLILSASDKHALLGKEKRSLPLAMTDLSLST
jgi:hypothetical protein